MGFLSSIFGKKEAVAKGPEPEEDPEQDSELAPGVPLEELSAALGAREGALRVDASRALLERWRAGDGLAAEVLAPRLPELLADKEPQVRTTALSGVRLLRKRENLEKSASAVLALLADPAAQVRTAAVWAAVKLPGEAARIQVRAVLDSTEEPMRFSAACALSDAKDPAALPELLAALHEDVRRQEAISALMSLGDPAALPDLAELFGDGSLGDFDRTLVAAARARLGDAAGGAHLIARIEEPCDDRPVAAEWAGRLGVQAAAPALTALADLEDDPARGAAMRALGRLKAAGAEDRLLRLAGGTDEPEDLRLDAVEGLAELGTPPALALLQQLAGGGGGELAALCRELLLEVAANAAAAEASRAAAAEGTSTAPAATVPTEER